MINLWTIPYTGTRFVSRILGSWEVHYKHRHISVASFADLDTEKCVVTLRDPMLARISEMNRAGTTDTNSNPVWLWRQVMRMQENPNVHFVRVDRPRPGEERRLEKWLGLDGHGQYAWHPVGTSPDRLGLKKTYELGEVPECLKRDEYLLQAIGATRFFMRHGYDLPWMSEFSKSWTA